MRVLTLDPIVLVVRPITGAEAGAEGFFAELEGFKNQQKQLEQSYK